MGECTRWTTCSAPTAACSRPPAAPTRPTRSWRSRCAPRAGSPAGASPHQPPPVTLQSGRRVSCGEEGPMSNGQALEALRTDGYVILRGVLPDPVLEEACDALRPLL